METKMEKKNLIYLALHKAKIYKCPVHSLNHVSIFVLKLY